MAKMIAAICVFIFVAYSESKPSPQPQGYFDYLSGIGYQQQQPFPQTQYYYPTRDNYRPTSLYDIERDNDKRQKEKEIVIFKREAPEEHQQEDADDSEIFDVAENSVIFKPLFRYRSQVVDRRRVYRPQF